MSNFIDPYIDQETGTLRNLIGSERKIAISSVLKASRLNSQQRTSSYASFRNKKYESKLSIYYFFNLLKGYAFLCCFHNSGGSERIRTSGTVARTHAFQACSLNHSDTLPSCAIISDFTPICKPPTIQIKWPEYSLGPCTT